MSLRSGRLIQNPGQKWVKIQSDARVVLAQTKMSSFTRYVTRTETVLEQIIADKLHPWKRATTPALNGEPWKRLRESTDLEKLRKQGAFFTSRRLAHLAIELPLSQGIVTSDLIGFDPACGAGDLLLTIARHLGRRTTLSETLEYWERHLVGIDKSPQFVRLTKIRLALLALHLGASPRVRKSFDLSRFFPEIKSGNSLKSTTEFRRANFVALNPPFFLTKASRDCAWGNGRITAAAQFMEYAVMNSREGSRLVGILPEVLRTGSSYQRWRTVIENHTNGGVVRHLGLFDNNADVHVFVLSATKLPRSRISQRIDWWRRSAVLTSTVNDLFEVHVGSVVPHRHRKVGPVRPYLHARSATPWERIDRIEETRKFRGTTFQAPFVAIRRTSRPEDRNRAVATLIAMPGEIAVENHLIVCKPKSGTITDCKRLMRQLRQATTDRFLNERIRCRHLTVSAVREIPMPKPV